MQYLILQENGELYTSSIRFLGRFILFLNKRQRLLVSPDDSFCGILVTFSRLQNEINIQFSGYYPFFKRYASLSEIREAAERAVYID